MKTLSALLVLVLVTPAWSAPVPDWKVFAACAAAYRVNAAIVSPERSASMKSQISETADDYVAAAVARQRLQTKSDAAAAKKAVTAYERQRFLDFQRRKREQVEQFIDTCPQTDN